MNELIFRSIIEHASDAILVTGTSKTNSPEGPIIVFVNEAFTEMTGYSRDEVLGNTPRILQGPETDQNELDKLRQALKNGVPGHAKMINYKKSGEKFWTSISIYPVEEESSEAKYWVGIKRDITEQMRAYEEISTTLQELHHRVKNNLALLSGLMELQSRNEADVLLKKELQALTSRIKSIANIHELLYESKSLAYINIKDGITKLTKEIINTLQPKTDIKTKLKIQHIETLNINQAVPFSLILNEVVTNSINHAFKESRVGVIEIYLTQKNSTVELQVKDNGQGFPIDFNYSEINSTGMLLINTLSRQLNADFKYKNLKKGAAFELQFIRQDIKGIHSI